MNYPDSLADCRIGFIGAGKGAEDLATGFIKSGTISVQQMSASAPSDQELDKFKELDCMTTNDSNNIFSHLSETEDKNCFKIIFVYIKPKQYSRANSVYITHYCTLEHIVHVVIGGKTPKETKQKVRFARLAANNATAVCEGICALSLKHWPYKEDQPLKNFLTKLLSPIGLCEFAEDNEFYGISVLGGTGIAFVYEMIQALCDGGVKISIPRSVSTKISAQTVLGAALMVKNTEMSPIVLRDEVTEHKNATAHGLHALENRSFRAVVIDAIECADKRRRQWKRYKRCQPNPSLSDSE